jgi:hypothetical protein
MITAGPRSPGRGPGANHPAIDASGGTATDPSSSTPVGTIPLWTPRSGIEIAIGSPTEGLAETFSPDRTAGAMVVLAGALVGVRVEMGFVVELSFGVDEALVDRGPFVAGGPDSAPTGSGAGTGAAVTAVSALVAVDERLLAPPQLASASTAAATANRPALWLTTTDTFDDGRRHPPRRPGKDRARRAIPTRVWC